MAANLAKERKKRGLKLNHPEAAVIIHGPRFSKGFEMGSLYRELMSWCKPLLTRKDVMPGVPEMIPELQVEGTFPRWDETGDRPRADQVGDRMKKTSKNAAKVTVNRRRQCGAHRRR